MIETRLLYYFLAVAREQSITKAADTLHISQPTLSRQIIELEESLGKQLLVRGKKKVALTEDGAYLRSKAQEMIDLMEKTETTLKEESDFIGGDVYLGCGETPTMSFITEIFKEIQSEHPEIKFHIFSGDAGTVTERIDKGLIDVGLLLSPMPQDKYDYINLKKSDYFGLLIPKDCELATKEFVTIEDFINSPLIFPDQLYNGSHLLDWFNIDYSTLNVVANYNLIYNATFMVEQEMGYCFTLANLVNTASDRNLTFVPIKPDLKVDLVLATKKYQTFSPAVKLFLNKVRERIGAK